MKQTLILNCSVWEWTKDFEGTVRDNCQVKIVDGRFQTIDSSQSIENLDEYELVIDAKGQLMLPGLIDSHIHLGMLGESQFYINLEDCYSIESMCQKILQQSQAQGYEDLPFLMGHNWDQSKLGRLPSREDLDALGIRKPIFLWRACWHIGVANTEALKIANIFEILDTKQTIHGGSIDLDDHQQPTGILRERATESIFQSFAKYKTDAQAKKFLLLGMQIAAKYGLTMVQSNDEGGLKLYQEMLRDEHEIFPLRVFLTPVYSELTKVLELSNGPIVPFTLLPCDSQSRFAMERMKIFSDGSLGAETAALYLEDGSQESQVTANGSKYKGMLIHSFEALVTIIEQTMRHDFRVETHAIGDAAAEEVLHALRQALNNLKFEGLNTKGMNRPILTHCQVLSKELIEWMHELQVIANVQPSFVPTDLRWLKQRLLPSQIDYSYAWKTLMQSKVHVAGGSDAPIEHSSPFKGIYDAIFRTNKRRIPSTECSQVFRPEESLSFAEALWIYTVEGAYCGGCEDQLGRIQPGYVADFVLVSKEITSDYELIHDLLPDLVVVGGEISIDNRVGSSDSSPVFLKGNTQGNPSPQYQESIEGQDTIYQPGKGSCTWVNLPFACPCHQMYSGYCQPI